MALYTIGDPHLSLSVEKPMDVFRGWEDYVQRLEESWRRTVAPEDTVVLPGDISWGMSLEEALADFRFLDGLPGEKILLKGNHDYWWTTRAKMEGFLQREGIGSIRILHKGALAAQGKCICGTRGWMFEKGQPHDRKLVAREAIRLEASLADGRKRFPGLEPIVFLHYPPLYMGESCPEILEVMARYGVRRCYYGHIHAQGCACAFNGTADGIRYRLVSSDFLGFCPLLVE